MGEEGCRINSQTLAKVSFLDMYDCGKRGIQSENHENIEIEICHE